MDLEDLDVVSSGTELGEVKVVVAMACLPDVTVVMYVCFSGCRLRGGLTNESSSGVQSRVSCAPVRQSGRD